jgi:FkbH-like protein
LLALARCADAQVLTIHVSDRLGDYGLVGVLALRLQPPMLHVILLALSCRVLRRGVETQVMRELARRAHAAGCAEIEVVFRATGRNAPVRELLDALVDPEGRREQPHDACRYRLAADALPARFARLDPL